MIHVAATAVATAAKTRLARRAAKTLLVVAPVVLVAWISVAILLALMFAGAGITSTNAQAPASNGCGVALQAGTTSSSLDDTQLRNAATIVAVGRQENVPAFGWVVAVATAMQESGLRTLDYGDRDSLGLFQQREPWGTPAQRMDAASSARMFYTGGQGGQPGLLDVTGWTGMALTVAAQSVQASGFPTAYAQWSNLAGQVVGTPAIGAATCTGTAGFPTSRTEAQLVAFGRELQGLGIDVSEHEAFGGVSPTAHAPGGWHYRGGALDLNYDGHPIAEKAKLDSLVPLIKARGFRLICQTTGHYTHQHIDIGTGPDLGDFITT